MKLGDIVIVKEDADWFPEFKQNRKFIVVDFVRRDNYDYVLQTYNWPQSLRENVFNIHNDFVYITETDSEELIVLDREFVKMNPMEKIKIQ